MTNKTKMSFLALCAVGLESILTNELKILGFTPYDRKAGRVFFHSAEPLLQTLFKANYFLRTTDRIFLVIAQKKVKDFDSFFALIHDIEWESFFKKHARIIIDKVSSFRSLLASEHTLQSVGYKSICTRLCSKWNVLRLNESGKAHIVRLYLENDELFVCLDTSGEPLYKRSYRLSGGLAPLRETVAASLLQFMQWKRKYPLHDGFAGSGTIPIEASLYAYNIPPGINRSFAFEDFNCFGTETTKMIEDCLKEKAVKDVRLDCKVRISASDIDSSAVSLCEANYERAAVVIGRALNEYGRNEHIPRLEFYSSDFKDLQMQYDEGMIISNPPYGKRLGEKEAVLELYVDIARKMRELKGWKMGFLSTQDEFTQIFHKENKSLNIKAHPIKMGNMQMHFYIASNI